MTVKTVLRNVHRLVGGGSAGRREPSGDSAAERPPAARREVAPTARVGAVSDAGRARGHNEDAFYVAEDGGLMAVADGMGGHEAGDVAAAIAVSAVAEFLAREQHTARQDDEDANCALLRRAIEAAHERVLDGARRCPATRAMGATLIVARIVGDRLFTGHVGDVRCYVRSRSGFGPITHDHSVVGTLVRSGQLSPEQARVHPNKHEVLQAAGMPGPLVPELNVRTLSDGDLVLVCSDGLWEALTDSEIGAVVDWDGTMRQRAIQLVDRAIDAGAEDNVTVVMYEHGTGSDSGRKAPGERGSGRSN
jgi:protein phosphatase